jgi:hypothetical protein
MKRIFVLFAFILTASFAHAQQASQAAPTAAELAHSQALRLQKVVGLSEDQLTQAEAIFLSRNTEIEAIKADASKTQQQKDDEIALIRKSKEKEIMALLTADQLIKYNDYKAKRAARRNGGTEQE